MLNNIVNNLNGSARKTSSLFGFIFLRLLSHVNFVQGSRDIEDPSRDNTKEFLINDLIDFNKREIGRNVWWLIGFIMLLVIPIILVLVSSQLLIHKKR
jgi:hypothetical protein